MIKLKFEPEDFQKAFEMGEAWRFHEDERAYPWDVTHTARLVDIEEEE